MSRTPVSSFLDSNNSNSSNSNSNSNSAVLRSVQSVASEVAPFLSNVVAFPAGTGVLNWRCYGCSTPQSSIIDDDPLLAAFTALLAAGTPCSWRYTPASTPSSSNLHPVSALSTSTLSTSAVTSTVIPQISTSGNNHIKDDIIVRRELWVFWAATPSSTSQQQQQYTSALFPPPLDSVVSRLTEKQSGTVSSDTLSPSSQGSYSGESNSPSVQSAVTDVPAEYQQFVNAMRNIVSTWLGPSGILRIGDDMWAVPTPSDNSSNSSSNNQGDNSEAIHHVAAGPSPPPTPAAINNSTTDTQWHLMRLEFELSGNHLTMSSRFISKESSTLRPLCRIISSESRHHHHHPHQLHGISTAFNATSAILAPTGTTVQLDSQLWDDLLSGNSPIDTAKSDAVLRGWKSIIGVDLATQCAHSLDTHCHPVVSVNTGSTSRSLVYYPSCLIYVTSSKSDNTNSINSIDSINSTVHSSYPTLDIASARDTTASRSSDTLHTLDQLEMEIYERQKLQDEANNASVFSPPPSAQLHNQQGSKTAKTPRKSGSVSTPNASAPSTTALGPSSSPPLASSVPPQTVSSATATTSQPAAAPKSANVAHSVPSADSTMPPPPPGILDANFGFDDTLMGVPVGGGSGGGGISGLNFDLDMDFNDSDFAFFGGDIRDSDVPPAAVSDADTSLAPLAENSLAITGLDLQSPQLTAETSELKPSTAPHPDSASSITLELPVIAVDEEQSPVSPPPAPLQPPRPAPLDDFTMLTPPPFDSSTVPSTFAPVTLSVAPVDSSKYSDVINRFRTDPKGPKGPNGVKRTRTEPTSITSTALPAKGNSAKRSYTAQREPQHFAWVSKTLRKKEGESWLSWIKSHNSGAATSISSEANAAAAAAAATATAAEVAVSTGDSTSGQPLTKRRKLDHSDSMEVPLVSVGRIPAMNQLHGLAFALVHSVSNASSSTFTLGELAGSIYPRGPLTHSQVLRSGSDMPLRAVDTSKMSQRSQLLSERSIFRLIDNLASVVSGRISASAAVPLVSNSVSKLSSNGLILDAFSVLGSLGISELNILQYAELMDAPRQSRVGRLLMRRKRPPGYPALAAIDPPSVDLSIAHSAPSTSSTSSVSSSSSSSSTSDASDTLGCLQRRLGGGSSSVPLSNRILATPVNYGRMHSDDSLDDYHEKAPIATRRTSTSMASLPLWSQLGLGPRDGPHNVTWIGLVDSFTPDSRLAMAWYLKLVGLAYSELLHLGRHEPLVYSSQTASDTEALLPVGIDPGNNGKNSSGSDGLNLTALKQAYSDAGERLSDFICRFYRDPAFAHSKHRNADALIVYLAPPIVPGISRGDALFVLGNTIRVIDSVLESSSPHLSNFPPIIYQILDASSISHEYQQYWQRWSLHSLDSTNQFLQDHQIQQLHLATTESEVSDVGAAALSVYCQTRSSVSVNLNVLHGRYRLLSLDKSDTFPSASWSLSSPVFCISRPHAASIDIPEVRSNHEMLSYGNSSSASSNNPPSTTQQQQQQQQQQQSQSLSNRRKLTDVADMPNVANCAQVFSSRGELVAASSVHSASDSQHRWLFVVYEFVSLDNLCPSHPLLLIATCSDSYGIEQRHRVFYSDIDRSEDDDQMTIVRKMMTRMWSWCEYVADCTGALAGICITKDPRSLITDIERSIWVDLWHERLTAKVTEDPEVKSAVSNVVLIQMDDDPQIHAIHIPSSFDENTSLDSSSSGDKTRLDSGQSTVFHPGTRPWIRPQQRYHQPLLSSDRNLTSNRYVPLAASYLVHEASQVALLRSMASPLPRHESLSTFGIYMLACAQLPCLPTFPAPSSTTAASLAPTIVLADLVKQLDGLHHLRQGRMAAAGQSMTPYWLPLPHSQLRNIVDVIKAIDHC